VSFNRLFGMDDTLKMQKRVSEGMEMPENSTFKIEKTVLRTANSTFKIEK